MPVHKNLNYQITGNGIPFVFQHGLASRLSQAQELLSELKKIQLISMDCPGHGHSPLTESITPSFNQYADLLVDLLNHLSIDRAIFGGISMGSGIALNMAIRYPEKVKALILIRPAWLDDKRPQNLQILEVAAPYVANVNPKDFQDLAGFQKINQKLPMAAESLMGIFDPGQQKSLPTVLQNMVNDRPLEKMAQLNNLDVPTIVIGNDDDPLHPFKMAENIHQHIHGSEIFHVISRYRDNDVHTHEVNTIITQFITKYEKQLER